MKFERPPMSRFVYPILALLIMAPFEPAASQQPPSAPSVGVIKVERKPITEATEFIGRIQAVERVNLSARVTAFLVRRQFVLRTLGPTYAQQGIPPSRAAPGLAAGDSPQAPYGSHRILTRKFGQAKSPVRISERTPLCPYRTTYCLHARYGL